MDDSPEGAMADLARRGKTAAWIFAALVAASPALAQTLPDATLSFADTSSKSFDWGATVGFDYVTGNYGAKCAVTLSLTCTSTGTTVFELPATAMLQIERLRLQVTVPYVDIEGPGQLAGDLGVPVIIAPLNTEPKHRSGLGDITVGAAYILLRENLFMPRIELAGTTKLPTAADGLGTGQTDYGAQVNLYRTLLPWLTTVGSVGYEWVGDINTVKLHSGWDATAGANAKFLGLGGGALFNYQQSAWAGAPDYFTLNPYVTWHMLGVVGITLYGTVGLTRSSPSQAFGIRFSL
jgi:hypothetical protein